MVLRETRPHLGPSRFERPDNWHSGEGWPSKGSEKSKRKSVSSTHKDHVHLTHTHIHTQEWDKTEYFRVFYPKGESDGNE